MAKAKAINVHALVKNGREERTFVARELRITGGEAGADGKTTPRKLEGYAAVFNSLSQDLGGFRELIKPGAFNRSLQSKPDVRCYFNHNRDLILGRTAAGTLRLEEDQVGLKMECDLPNTSYSQDLQESMKRGDISQMSFAFKTRSDAWRTVDGEQIREIDDADIYDASPVSEAAYLDTKVALRSLAKARPGAPAGKSKIPSDQDNRQRLLEMEVGLPLPGEIRQTPAESDNEEQELSDALDTLAASAQACMGACDDVESDCAQQVSDTCQELITQIQACQAELTSGGGEDESEDEEESDS